MGVQPSNINLKALLSQRPILKPYPKDGPSCSKLATTALKLVQQSMDFATLVDECDWESQQSSQGILQLIREQIRFKPSFSGFSELEVLETLIIQTGKKYIQAVDQQGVERIAKLTDRLRLDGVIDLHNNGKELTNTIVPDAKILWFLVKSKLLSINFQFSLAHKKIIF